MPLEKWPLGSLCSWVSIRIYFRYSDDYVPAPLSVSLEGSMETQKIKKCETSQHFQRNFQKMWVDLEIDVRVRA